MLSVAWSVTNAGFDSHEISVECDSTESLPAISIVWLAGKNTEEATDRFRGAVRNSQLELPAKKYTINLAPADISKNDSGLDPATACSSN